MSKKTDKSDSQYKGVCRFRKSSPKERWSAQAHAPNGNKISVIFGTELEAARAVDLFYINNGVEPVNIFKRV